MSRNALVVCLGLAVTTGMWAQAPQAPEVARDFVAASPSASFDEPFRGRVAAITDTAIRTHLDLLASPAMEGRGLGTRGLDAALEYAAASLKLAGIAPFGEESGYFQRVPLRQLSDVTGTIEIERQSGPLTDRRSFVHGVDCLFPPLPPQSLHAPVVFAGFGIREPALGRDDYAGLDVRGRIVLLLGGVPPGPEWQKAELTDRYAAGGVKKRFAAKIELARALGAAAILAVEDDGFAADMAASFSDEEVAFRTYDHEKRHEAPVVIRVSRALACAVVGEDALAAAFRGQRVSAVPGTATASVRLENKERLIVSRNVLGIIPGADPALREEAVMIGAHIDHLGMQGGTLHPGADDNASGVSALLEIAKAFVAGAPPKRTLVLAFWTGEEEGRFGSVYYVNHPRWPLAKTVAYLNLDMIGHPWLPAEIRTLVTDSKLPEGEAFLAATRAESFVEPGLPRGVPILESVLRKSAQGNGLTMHFDWTDGKEGGSDYRDFARAGVPFIRFFGNFFPDYHEPGDTPDRIDAAQVQRVARFAFAAAWQLANP
ncbi:MAG: M20/M25/M40 family metallo-hydrolase [Acidobacteriota bacterium]